MTTLAIEIISGQHFPRATGSNIDPYVTIRILGHPPDQQKFSTKSVSSNGKLTNLKNDRIASSATSKTKNSITIFFSYFIRI